MLLSGNAAEKFPPAGGMGDWGLPQQARLSYKRYACASAAHGGVGCFPPTAGRFLRGRLIPIQADTVRTFSRKKEMSGNSARHPVSQGPSAQGVNVTPKIETAGCLDDTLPVIITVQNHGRAPNAPVSPIFALRNQEFALF